MAIDQNLLPPVMRTLVSLIGFDHTLELVEARGGQRVHIPLEPSLRWIEQVGADNARRLCDRYGGQDIDVPKRDKVTQQLRDAAIREDRATHSLNQLAAKYGLTRRRIQTIVREDPPAEPDLFGQP